MSSLPRRRSSFYRTLKGVELEEEFYEDVSLKVQNNMWLFECAWEVANKVGGIYTVIRTKTPVTVDEWGDRYILMGPLNDTTVNIEVEQCPLMDIDLMKVVSRMRDQGVRVATGRWLIDGNPQVILFDIGSSAWRLDTWKRELWEMAHIGIPLHDKEANDALILGNLCGWFLAEFQQQVSEMMPSRIMAHFHEWLAGMGLVVTRCKHLDVVTIFTTHATLLGRYLCAGNADFYNNLDKVDSLITPTA